MTTINEMIERVMEGEDVSSVITAKAKVLNKKEVINRIQTAIVQVATSTKDKDKREWLMKNGIKIAGQIYGYLYEQRLVVVREKDLK